MLTNKRIASCSTVAFFVIGICSALATSNYDYKKDEYVTISNGVSPDRRFSIKAHGEGDLGYNNFHLYLFDETNKKRIGPLTEIADTLDTGAEAFAARWSEDSKTVMIIYRVDRHAPLKSMTYTLARNRALPNTRKPIDVTSPSLQEHWIRYGSGYFNPDGSRKKP